MKLSRSTWGQLALLWLAGASLRVTILAVPPVLPEIHSGLHLDETLVGVLSSLPLVLLAAAAVFGSLLVARIGARRCLLLGLAVVAVASASRGIGPSVIILFLTTFAMGVGIAVCQPTLPSIARRWFPRQTALATAVYSNGFLVGEIAATSLTVPVILPLLQHSWERDLAFWSVPVVLTTIALLLFTRHDRAETQDSTRTWWPDWRSRETWRLGLVLGCASTAYFGSNAFLPDYLKATHHSGLIAPALTSLNVGQFPASIATAVFARQIIGRRWPIAGAALVVLTALIGYRLGGAWLVGAAGFAGFSTAMVFVLTLALPPLLVQPHDVHRLSAALFTISYTLPFVGSFIGGAAWDLSGIPFAAFVPIAAACAAMFLLVLGSDFSRARHGQIVLEQHETI